MWSWRSSAQKLQRQREQREINSQKLYDASDNGDVATARALLADGNVDVNWPNAEVDGYTSLHIAVDRGHVDVVELLLNAGASPKTTAKTGFTPLHLAVRIGHVRVVELLLKAGAEIHATDQEVNIDVKAQVTTDTLKTLQVLVSFGATWDSNCDGIVASGNAFSEAPALRLCVQLWVQEHTASRPFSKIPLEVVKRGPADTQAYIDALLKSDMTTFRRRICVIGPSTWGKTSLIKSLTTGESSLDHPDDRTIGIDIFTMEFDDGFDKYVISIWDYAGQEEYQPAHAVFFSERTVYFVCYDLHSGSLAKVHSEFRADDDVDFENRMDEFVSRKVLRWIRLVFARQPDAEYVLVSTKADVIRHNATRIEEVKEDLLDRLQAYADAYEAELAREIRAVRDRMPRTAMKETEAKDIKLDHLSKLKQHAGNMAPQQWLTMSCKDKQRVMTAKNDLEQLLVQTKDKSFEMPETYTSVLNSILEKRNASAHERSRLRVRNAFVSYDNLETNLKKDFPDLTNCQRFQNTVIIDPLLLIDFIRQIFDHNYNGETMPHTTLVGRPFWVDIATDDSLVLSLKQVLQHFHLVYPSRGEMTWDSELMVPAYWRTNVQSHRGIVGLPLRLEEEATKRVRWEYHFSSELPDAVYDHFVVTTYSSLQPRVVGPDGIHYLPIKSGTFACRAVVERKGRFTFIRVEALAGDSAKWHPFERLIRGMETVLKEFPGLLVTRNAIDSHGGTKNLEVVVADARECDVSEIDWLPPDVTWYDKIHGSRTSRN